MSRVRRQPVRTHRVRMGRDEFRIVQTNPVAPRIVLHDDRHSLNMYADRAGIAQLVTMWALAARSPRSLIHLPIRANRIPAILDADAGSTPLDLVLVHHSRQLRISSWKAIRSRIGAGRPHTVVIPRDDFPDLAGIDVKRWRHRSFRDHLRFEIAAHTLFVVGSATAFREYGAGLAGLASNTSSIPPEYPGHLCDEIESGSPSQVWGRAPGLLHIQYWRDW